MKGCKAAAVAVFVTCILLAGSADARSVPETGLPERFLVNFLPEISGLTYAIGRFGGSGDTSLQTIQNQQSFILRVVPSFLVM